jgi:Protein of unknown function (DUF3306)
MSEPETFVTRWSRLKRQAARTAEEQAPEPLAQPATGQAAATEAETEHTRKSEFPEPAFDPASLPSIESITAGTDIRAFLQSGVPAELTRAALRRAWTTDPAIRDFIGIAENQWDFTDPGAIPGFGPLQATDDVAKLVAQAMGKLDKKAEQLTGAGAEPPASGVRCSRPAADSDRSTAGVQEPGMPDEIADPASLAVEASVQQKPVDVAARDEAGPARDGNAPNRRGHGSAMPQ